MVEPSEAAALVAFWRDAGPKAWFAKDEAFDAALRARFLAAHEAADRGELDRWRDAPEPALALVLLLDQFPRNAFRATPRMFATDATARAAAAGAVDAGHDRATEEALRLFFYLPFAHSENLADQERSVALTTALGDEMARHAREHRDIVARFGRFPHRNVVLGRTSSAEEQAFLDAGGFAG